MKNLYRWFKRLIGREVFVFETPHPEIVTIPLDALPYTKLDKIFDKVFKDSDNE